MARQKVEEQEQQDAECKETTTADSSDNAEEQEQEKTEQAPTSPNEKAFGSEAVPKRDSSVSPKEEEKVVAHEEERETKEREAAENDRESKAEAERLRIAETEHEAEAESEMIHKAAEKDREVREQQEADEKERAERDAEEAEVREREKEIKRAAEEEALEREAEEKRLAQAEKDKRKRKQKEREEEERAEKAKKERERKEREEAKKEREDKERAEKSKREDREKAKAAASTSKTGGVKAGAHETTNQLLYVEVTVLPTMMKHKNAWPFAEPVDYKGLGLSDYPTIVKNPMDLGTIRKRLISKSYTCVQECIADIKQVFINCRLYNPPGTDVFVMCGQVEKIFNQKIVKMPPRETVLSREDEALMRNPSHKGPAKSKVGQKRPAKFSAGGPAKKVPTPYRPPNVQMKFCSQLLDEMLSAKHIKYAWIFYTPVDPVALSLPDYFDKIKVPMDLSLVKRNLYSGEYETPDEFAKDVRLMFNNCYTYNDANSEVFLYGQKLNEVFEARYAFLPNKGATSFTYPTSSTAPKSTSKKSSTSASDTKQSKPSSRAPSRSAQNTATASSAPPPKAAKTDPPAKKRKPAAPAASSSTAAASRKRPAQTQREPASRKAAKRDKSATPPPPQQPAETPLEERELSYEEKKRLSNSINQLPPEKIQGILEIIARDVSMQNFGGDEIEIDIDSLSTITLRCLDKFVTDTLEAVKAKARQTPVANPQARAHPEHHTSRPPPKNSKPQGNNSRSASAGSANNADKGGQAHRAAPVHNSNANARKRPAASQQQHRHRQGASSSSDSSSDSGSSSSDSDSDFEG
ncbi:hypothetical protein, variant [Sphaeroforma arctica JP610]|uniref:Bromo domain-containing protein n=1 Tax=Sphaeroforma arctica JP610 TaxID=667725 RepID=A0A0L0G326_9EUKA|nr:hypothetical protein, variant [Sphaeroforma arctica JP610]KNC83241.1 hypothetical protein, variant [Sphaeroforma arctica JP610]|eukprot:XP_014157143.1 hypothetical protein, variant [Sphaeroforma arctica JP610]